MCRRCSPIQNAAEAGQWARPASFRMFDSLRIPLKYLANMLTAGDEKPVALALERLLAMRAYKRAENVEGVEDLEVLKQVGLSKKQADEMYRYLAIANYEDRYVIPTGHRELNIPEAYSERGGCGFSFGNGCSSGSAEVNMFGAEKTTRRNVIKFVKE